MGQAVSASYEELLRRLTISDSRFLESLTANNPGDVPAARLDARTGALVRLGALVAIDAPAATFQCSVDAALASGATPDEVVDVLLTVAPLIGSARVTAAAPKLAFAVGYDVDAALEQLGTGEVRRP